MLVKHKTTRNKFVFWPSRQVGAPVGSFSLAEVTYPTKHMYLTNFQILQAEKRGHGYGQQMLREAIKLAGKTEIRLEVWHENTVARYVYEKAGFVIERASSDGKVLFMIRYAPT